MQAAPKVIHYLNLALANELVAINQYFLHARMLKNWGLSQLGEKEYQESLEEMKHADHLVERILFLEGIPNLQQLNKLNIGENVKEILMCDLALEEQAMPLLREAISHMESVKDYVSRTLLADILIDEEHHHDWLSTQLQLLEALGEQNYLQQQL